MKYFIHIVTDSERIPDREGRGYPDLEAARLDACQGARVLMADELIAGRPLPLGWRLQIADAEGSVLLTVSFAALVFGENKAWLERPFPPATRQELVARAVEVFVGVREINDGIQTALKDLHSKLGTLTRTLARPLENTSQG